MLPIVILRGLVLARRAWRASSSIRQVVSTVQNTKRLHALISSEGDPVSAFSSPNRSQLPLESMAVYLAGISWPHFHALTEGSTYADVQTTKKVLQTYLSPAIPTILDKMKTCPSDASPQAAYAHILTSIAEAYVEHCAPIWDAGLTKYLQAKYAHPSFRSYHMKYGAIVRESDTLTNHIALLTEYSGAEVKDHFILFFTVFLEDADAEPGLLQGASFPYSAYLPAVMYAHSQRALLALPQIAPTAGSFGMFVPSLMLSGPTSYAQMRRKSLPIHALPSSQRVSKDAENDAHNRSLEIAQLADSLEKMGAPGKTQSLKTEKK